MPVPRSHRHESQEGEHENAEQEEQYRRELNAFLATLTYEQRRLYAAAEVNRIGRGGVRRIVHLTGLCRPTIARGRRELTKLLEGKPVKRERKPVKGRPRVEEKYPGITAALEEMLSDELAGSPEGDQKWVRSSVRKLTQRLRELGFHVGHMSVWALLKRMGFSMRMNVRNRRGVCRDPAQRDERVHSQIVVVSLGSCA